jgi:ferric-dicitrate binding protein FerR (iron transport regulator)
MTEERMTKSTASSDELVQRDDDALATLMALAGPRAEVPLGVEHRVRGVVHDEWRRSTAVVRTIRWVVPLAMAASLVIAIGINSNSRSPLVSAPSVGAIALVAGAGTPSFAVGDKVRVGEVITTMDGQGISVALNSDISLRIAASSEVRVDALDEYSLISGQLYVDTGETIFHDRRITINTPYGSATDIGTQFLVSFDGAMMDVAVREGRVDVTDSVATYATEAGYRLALRSGGVAVVDPMAVDDPSWEWAIALAPTFEIENESLLDFLKWASRETGKELIFAGNDVRLAAMGIKLHGILPSLSPIEAAKSVLATTRFTYRIDESTISIDW